MARWFGRSDPHDLRSRFPPPAEAFAGDYSVEHTRFVSEVLDSPELLESFSEHGRLPDAWGIGLDERVVEYPWVFSRLPVLGRVLDAGSATNHPHILDRLLPRGGDLTMVTLAPEPASYPERRISYVYADLRDLPFRDDRFDLIISISTLEHVGYDNAEYGGDAARAPDPDVAFDQAAAELRRVLTPGGTMLITVPVGREEDHGWFRQLDRRGVERLSAALQPHRTSASFYGYSADGWQRVAGKRIDDARYHDVRVDPPAPDLAAAARAVACIELRFA